MNEGRRRAGGREQAGEGPRVGEWGAVEGWAVQPHPPWSSLAHSGLPLQRQQSPGANGSNPNAQVSWAAGPPARAGQPGDALGPMGAEPSIVVLNILTAAGAKRP